MRRRSSSVLGGIALLVGTIAGCTDTAESTAFAAEARADGVSDGELSDPAALVMPQRALSLTHSVVSDTIDAELATDLGLSDSELDADGGYEFVTVSFTVDEPTYDDDGGEGRVNVVTEDAPHGITEIVTDSLTDEEVVVVASVPVDSPVSLEITDEEKTA